MRIAPPVFHQLAHQRAFRVPLHQPASDLFLNGEEIEGAAEFSMIREFLNVHGFVLSGPKRDAERDEGRHHARPTETRRGIRCVVRGSYFPDTRTSPPSQVVHVVW